MTRVSQLKIWHFWVTERNVCRRTFNRYSIITQYAKLAAGEHLCRRCTRRKLQHFKSFKRLLKNHTFWAVTLLSQMSDTYIWVCNSKDINEIIKRIYIYVLILLLQYTAWGKCLTPLHYSCNSSVGQDFSLPLIKFECPFSCSKEPDSTYTVSLRSVLISPFL